MPTYRLYVAGWPDTLNSNGKELNNTLSNRFSPFGSIDKIEIINKANKLHPFAYINLQTTAKQYENLLTTYKNTKWGSNIFKVELAKLDYSARILYSQQLDSILLAAAAAARNSNNNNTGQFITQRDKSYWENESLTLKSSRSKTIKISAKKGNSIQFDHDNTSSNADWSEIISPMAKIKPTVEEVQQQISQAKVFLEQFLYDKGLNINEKKPTKKKLKLTKETIKKSVVEQLVQEKSASFDEFDEELQWMSSESEEFGVVEFDSEEEEEFDHQKKVIEEENEWAQLEMNESDDQLEEKLSDPQLQSQMLQTLLHPTTNTENNINTFDMKEKKLDRRALAETKRIEALKRKQEQSANPSIRIQSFEAQQHKFVEIDGITDAKETNKRSVAEWFDSDEEIQTERNTINELKPSLDLLTEEFELSSDLMQLQRSYKGDKRFKLNNLFNETQQEELQQSLEDNEMIANDRVGELKSEQLKTLELLDELFPTAAIKQSKALSMIRNSARDKTTISEESRRMEERVTREEEFEQQKKRKELFHWRQTIRFDPGNQQLELSNNNHLDSSKQTQAQEEAHQEDPREGTDNSVEVDISEELSDAANGSFGKNSSVQWSIRVPRLRDLVTEKNNSFSFASIIQKQQEKQAETEKEEELGEHINPVESLLSTLPVNEEESQFSLNIKTANKTNQFIEPTNASAPKLEPTPAPIIARPNQPKFSLTALLKEANAHNNLTQKSSANIKDSSGKADDNEISFDFMRSAGSTNLAAEQMWLSARSLATQDYKRKSKSAIKQRTKNSSKFLHKAKSML
jgi:hypothetical protein